MDLWSNFTPFAFTSHYYFNPTTTPYRTPVSDVVTLGESLSALLACVSLFTESNYFGMNVPLTVSEVPYRWT